MEGNRSLEIVWDEKARRFETEDKEAFLQYQLRDILLAALCEDGEQEKVKKLPAVAMDMVHTYVPRSKRGLGLAGRLCDAAFTQAHCHSMLLVPTCSYISTLIYVFSDVPRNFSFVDHASDIGWKEEQRVQLIIGMQGSIWQKGIISSKLRRIDILLSLSNSSQVAIGSLEGKIIALTSQSHGTHDADRSLLG